MLHALANRPGVHVRAVYNRHKPDVEAANIETISADLLDPAQCRRVLAGADRAFLFAGLLAPAPMLARDPVGAVTTNLRLAVNMLEAAWAENVPRLVWLGSTTAYPELDHPLAETDLFIGEPPKTWAGLGWVTRYVETFCRHLAELAVKAGREMDISVLCPSMIYGEHDHFDGDSAHFLPALMRRIVAREHPIEVWGDGSQKRDLIHASDVVRAALMASETVKGYDCFNIAAGTSHSVNEILHHLIAADGFVEAEVVHKIDRPQTAALRQFACDKARRVLGFNAEIGIGEGIRRTLQWYRGRLAGQRRV
jgi:nucleoside-diphosphate-sugar epimerase